MYTVLFSLLFLIVGVTSGWFFSEKYRVLVEADQHEFDELFEENPHPEIYTKDGKIHKGEYVAINFELGYNPEDYFEDDVVEE